MSLGWLYNWNRLTEEQRATVLRAVEIRTHPDDDDRFELVIRAGVSQRALNAAMRELSALEGRTAPEVGALRLLHLHERGWSYEQLAADDSPMFDYLKGSSALEDGQDSRKQKAWETITRKVQPFSESGPAWWVNFCRSTAINDWAHAGTPPPTRKP